MMIDVIGVKKMINEQGEGSKFRLSPKIINYIKSLI